MVQTCKFKYHLFLFHFALLNIIFDCLEIQRNILDENDKLLKKLYEIACGRIQNVNDHARYLEITVNRNS